MPTLPSPEEQEALLSALAALVSAQGAAPLLRGPIEPSPRFFPDAWRPDVEGARAVLARVMEYAGLAELRCALESGEGVRQRPESLGREARFHTAGAAAWFYGIAEGAAWFGVDRRAVADPEKVVAALCHEAAHAYRRHHALEGDAAVEELQTDVTTVFLGFGILTTNASSRTRTKGELMGTMVRHQWSHSSLGYLPPESMAYLLAAQVVVRRADRRERHHLRDLLEPNQAASFAAACRRLRRDEAALLRRLGLAADRRPVQPPEPAMPPLHFPDAPPRESGRALRNAGKPVFRVPRASSIASRRAVGLLLGATAGFAVMRFWGGGAWGPIVLALVGSAMGQAIGAASQAYECSDPGCNADLSRVAAVCPGCGGTVSGALRNANERLAAEERLRRKAREVARDADAP